LVVSCYGRGRPILYRDRCTVTSSSHGTLTTRLGPLVRDCLFVRQACLFRSSPPAVRHSESTSLLEAVHYPPPVDAPDTLRKGCFPSSNLQAAGLQEHATAPSYLSPVNRAKALKFSKNCKISLFYVNFYYYCHRN